MRSTIKSNKLLSVGYCLLLGLYNLLYTMSLPLIFVRLSIKGRKYPSYNKRWSQRLGFIPIPPTENILWVHAVSVGEAISAIPLVKELQKYNHPILLTTTTPTGSERVMAAFKDDLGGNLHHFYFPFDVFWVWKRFLSRVKPKLLVLMETEIWPSLLHELKLRGIPVIVANARLSPRSHSRYQAIKPLMQKILEPVKLVLAQSEADLKLFSHFVSRDCYLKMVGNIKYDLSIPDYLKNEVVLFKNKLEGTRYILTAASTHEGEELKLLDVYQKLKNELPSLLLVLVPRHPDRFKQVYKLCQQQGFRVQNRSDMSTTIPQNVDIFLGDTMGEMLLFYAVADLAFVGGSLVPVGGHNLLEPAALKLPILTGPYLFNFAQISETLLQEKALIKVNDENELCKEILKLSQASAQANMMGEAAFSVVEKNRGALNKHIEYITPYLEG